MLLPSFKIEKPRDGKRSVSERKGKRSRKPETIDLQVHFKKPFHDEKKKRKIAREKQNEAERETNNIYAFCVSDTLETTHRHIDTYRNTNRRHTYTTHAHDTEKHKERPKKTYRLFYQVMN